MFLYRGFGFFVEPGEVRRRILEFLKSTGGASIYQIAKNLGLSYGAAQWHVFVLEREGLVMTVVHGRRRVAIPRDTFDAYLSSLKVKDFFRDLWQLLRGFGIEGDTPFVSALRVLQEERRGVAACLLDIAKNLYEAGRSGGEEGQSL
ncbi:MAG: winged helix-turn-helix domain-containing protein [Pyrobaculum sp.]